MPPTKGGMVEQAIREDIGHIIKRSHPTSVRLAVIVLAHSAASEHPLVIVWCRGRSSVNVGESATNRTALIA